ncbi:uncharacterized protein EV422DRAFT_246282 [Fimicolochytrium jonesii]|uniref:uncharacterized protein n=1 Tax=Fimicolochytrium jonesii TaxID=1396493 RepID=UPI0022FEBEC6|nr:uncharacterized protein EV422DRAFT_246282 [Fimicolochytrium jonesii]KAI8825114.1 hypothetical protein EV422DRAFT_246282 [Fimicolochytrium jonesii]
MGKPLTPQKRAAIVALHKAGKNKCEIARLENVSLTAVKRTIKVYSNQDSNNATSYQSKKPSGRPKKSQPSENELEVSHWSNQGDPLSLPAIVLNPDDYHPLTNASGALSCLVVELVICTLNPFNKRDTISTIPKIFSRMRRGEGGRQMAHVHTRTRPCAWLTRENKANSNSRVGRKLELTLIANLKVILTGKTTCNNVSVGCTPPYMTSM